MNKRPLKKEPLNLIICGVGGQGNILLSALVGTALLNEGYMVSVADTYGVSQRGGSVTSHVRISKETLFSSITISGKADIILGMEPVETLRALGEFGNPNVVSIVNPRPIYPSGGVVYPDLNEVKEMIIRFSLRTIFVNATEEALEIGDPIYANIILLGSLVGVDILPISKETILDTSLKAFNKGLELIVSA